jgi:hypothetical protein
MYWPWRVLVFACATVAGLAAQSPGTAGELSAVLAQVGASAERYFERAQNLICREEVTVQPVGRDRPPGRRPRLEYETRVAWEALTSGREPELTVQRQLVKIDDRTPGPDDKPGCVAPRDVSPEPLAILLPENQKNYRFTIEGKSRADNRATLTLGYTSLKTGPITSKVTDKECWMVELPGRDRGRFWIDVKTGEVLRHDTALTGVFDIELPATPDRPDSSTVTIERLETSTIYRAVTFKDPDETILLPRSVEKVQVVRNAERVRVRHEFSDYQRFTTSVRIVQD